MERFTCGSLPSDTERPSEVGRTVCAALDGLHGELVADAQIGVTRLREYLANLVDHRIEGADEELGESGAVICLHGAKLSQITRVDNQVAYFLI